MTQLDIVTAGAVNIMARHIAANFMEDALAEKWEDFPDIGENDWHAVTAAAAKQAEAMRPTDADWREAYEYLSKRAEGQEA